MRVNSEAIYGTRAIAPYAEGRVRMTRQKNGTTYFLYLPEKGETTMPAEVRVSSHQPAPGASVTLLGSTATLAWRAEGNGFVVTIPASVGAAPPCQHAWAIKVTAVRQ